MSGIISNALSGLNAAQTRANVASNNIANAHSSGSTDGTTKPAYTPQDVVQISQTGGGVSTSVQDRDPATSLAPDPDQPYADADGLVAVPNVSYAQELVTLKTAEHAYKASAAVIKTAQELDDALSEIV